MIQVFELSSEEREIKRLLRINHQYFVSYVDRMNLLFSDMNEFLYLT